MNLRYILRRSSSIPSIIRLDRKPSSNTSQKKNMDPLTVKPIKALKIPKISKSNKDTTKEEKIQNFQCFFCDEFMTSKSKLKDHLKSVHKSNLYPCVHCGEKGFNTLKDYIAHLKFNHPKIKKPKNTSEFFILKTVTNQQLNVLKKTSKNIEQKSSTKIKLDQISNTDEATVIKTNQVSPKVKKISMKNDSKSITMLNTSSKFGSNVIIKKSYYIYPLRKFIKFDIKLYREFINSKERSLLLQLNVKRKNLYYPLKSGKFIETQKLSKNLTDINEDIDNLYQTPAMNSKERLSLFQLNSERKNLSYYPMKTGGILEDYERRIKLMKTASDIDQILSRPSLSVKKNGDIIENDLFSTASKMIENVLTEAKKQFSLVYDRFKK